MRHLNLYRALKVVVREGSIRKAADILAISPSALNRQILALEDELGVPFFDRLPGGVRLSTAGEVYYRHFIEHVAEIDRAAATVADLSGMRIGHVQIAASRELESGIVPREIRRFREMHPRVRFSVLSARPEEVPALLASGDADLALTALPTVSQGVEVLAIEDLALQALVAEAAAPETGVVALAALEDFDLILPPEGSSLGGFLRREMARRRIRLDPAVESHAVLEPVIHPRPSLQFCLGPDLGDTRLRGLGAQLVQVERLPPVPVALQKREGRALPVAAGNFARQFAKAMNRQA